MTLVVSPTIPLTVSLPGGRILPGQSIVIMGQPKPFSNRFCINIIKSATTHCLLHFDNRFDQGVTVRNVNWPNGSWQHEERSPLTLQRGRNFVIQIKCMQDRFQIFVDGRYHCDFVHRCPMMEADALKIEGDVTIQRVQFKTTQSMYGY